jgi:hypothetical protein
MTTCTLTGKFIYDTGDIPVGTLTLTMAPDALFNVDTLTVISKKDIVIALDDTGSFTEAIQATDDSEITPRYWTYHVVESWDGGREYDIQAPENTTVDITQVAPVPSFVGVPIVVGPQGPVGPPGTGGAEQYVLSSVSSWSKEHDYSYLPDVRFYKSDGSRIMFGYDCPDSSHVYVEFPTPFTGTVVLS